MSQKAVQAAPSGLGCEHTCVSLAATVGMGGVNSCRISSEISVSVIRSSLMRAGDPVSDIREKNSLVSGLASVRSFKDAHLQ